MRTALLFLIVGVGVSCAAFMGAQITPQQNPQPKNAQESQSFNWPTGKRAAVSLSFDDARSSQVDTGLALLRKEGVKATFFVTSGNLEERLAGWKQAVADGHEIGNHSLTHPCTGNYPFSLNNALENYDLRMMAQQLDGANEQIQKLLGVKPRTFAYPCGQTFVGRGLDERSYVPLVAERFLVGRGYLDEAANNPAFCDLSRAMGTPFDDMGVSQMKKLIDEAAADGRWVIFVGHEIGPRRYQTTDADALVALCEYLKDSANGIWLAPVEEIGRYVLAQRSGKDQVFKGQGRAIRTP
jgi:peptidoglycan-N-acetylglucosamine deacetylase